MKHVGSVLLLTFLLAGCNLQSAPPLSSPINPVFTAIPTFTSSPQPPPAFTPLPTATLAPYTPFHVVTWADNVNLRINPGTLFPVMKLLAKGTRLLLLGRTPGGGWLYVSPAQNIFGWVDAHLVEAEGDLETVPFIKPEGAQLVRGHVVDLAGVPISGVGFAVQQGAASNALRTDASTDANGYFYAYLPADAAGEWLVAYVSIACTSNTMDANCNCIGYCGQADPTTAFVTLPQGNEILSFVWR